MSSVRQERCTLETDQELVKPYSSKPIGFRIALVDVVLTLSNNYT